MNTCSTLVSASAVVSKLLTEPESANVIFACLRDMTGLEKAAMSSKYTGGSATIARPTCTTEVWCREKVCGLSDGDVSIPMGVSTIAEGHI